MGPTCSHGCPKNHLKMVQKKYFSKSKLEGGLNVTLMNVFLALLFLLSSKGYITLELQL
jgi:hypothetical protein